ncbi:MAG: transposase [Trichocoleus desertorum ATA4-8-CV12]|nr:transposase [Trichocoleus desertorum ATA4-8-CV12]
MNSVDQLEAFRQSVYERLGKGRDALFDLMDAILVSRSITSFAELSLSAVFRRQWPSVYAAIRESHPPRDELLKLYAQHLPQPSRLVLAGDHTAWSRLYARTLRDRTYEHQAPPMSGSKPVTVGHGYSTLAWIPEAQGSWALPLLHERISSFESPISKAAGQLKAVCEQLQGRPLSLWDAEYGCAPFILQTAAIACDKLMRVRSNRVLYKAPPAYAGKGRPRKHGDKFKLNDEQTWGQADQCRDVESERLGPLRLQLWHHLHFSRSAAHPMHLIRVERRAEGRVHPPLWLVWVGQSLPDLNELWQYYLRRFAIDHWYRFVKQRLHWSLPRFATPEQGQTWSDLMPLLTWQLWLARPWLCQTPLPWQKLSPLPSPGRVADSFAPLLARIGSPAPNPKPRGKSPGWLPGRTRTRRIRYPIVKKGFKRPKKMPIPSA